MGLLQIMQIVLATCAFTLEINAFAPKVFFQISNPKGIQHAIPRFKCFHQTLFMAAEESWTSIVQEPIGNGWVKKMVLQEGNGDVPEKGSAVEIEYTGIIGSSPASWGVEDVIECWLQNLQGLYDVLNGPFRENNIDGAVLFDSNKFTEAFLSEELGISNRIQCKKTIMAAKRLIAACDEFPEGTKFDSSLDRGKNYEFILGQGKAIQAIDRLVSTMRVGEKAKVICRSDYGYGSEGFRRSTGEVVVPPFATLCFEVSLVSIS